MMTPPCCNPAGSSGAQEQTSDAALPPHLRRDTQSVLPTDWRLWGCNRSSGAEKVLLWGPEAPMRAELERMAGAGCDVWLIDPAGEKHLPGSWLRRRWILRDERLPTHADQDYVGEVWAVRARVAEGWSERPELVAWNEVASGAWTHWTSTGHWPPATPDIAG